MKTYTPTAGMHIKAACAEACKIADADNEDVGFSFNGIDLVATPSTGPDVLAEEWERISDERAEAYRNSPEGRAEAARRAEEIAFKKSHVKALVDGLPEVLRGGGMAVLMGWLEEFTCVADDVGIGLDHAELQNMFIAAGYVTGYGVGNPPEWFNTSDRLGRYIVGQVMSCLQSKMPPHPMTVSFISEWRRLPKEVV